jgi:flagellar hook-associated protein 1
VNSLVLNDQRYFASGLGGGPGDNTNALKLAQFVDVSQGVLNGLSIDQFYNSLVANVAQSAAAENALVEGSRNFRDALMIQREQRSGVSIDEEMITIMMLQRNYQAAARIITTVDQLLNTLLNI